jgi:hypothetical protein
MVPYREPMFAWRVWCIGWMASRKGQSVQQPVKQPVRQLIRQSVRQSARQSVRQSGSQAVRQSGSQAVSQAASRAVGQAAGQAVSQAASRAVGQAAGQAVSQAVDQVVGQAAVQAVSQAVGQAVGQAVDAGPEGLESVSLRSRASTCKWHVSGPRARQWDRREEGWCCEVRCRASACRRVGVSACFSGSRACRPNMTWP